MDIAYQIPRLALLWVLSSVLLVVLPHVLRLPAWITVLALACIIWRLLIFVGRANYPGKLVKAVLVMVVLPLTVVQTRAQGVGVDAAVTLLLLGVVFKLLEMQYKRDIVIVIALCYVLIMVGFIYSQTIPASLYSLMSATVITGALISLNRDNARNTFANNSRLAARIVLQAIPLTIVLFVLVPRVSPLWTMPLPVSQTRTGITDEMTPGDISSLGRSAELAFRVSFDGAAPAHQQLYWRGLVLDFFDGRTWRRAGSSFLSFNMVSRSASPSRGIGQGTPVAYDVILEPTQQTWLYALQLAELNAQDIAQDRNYTLQTSKPISQRMRYQVRSYLENQTDLELTGTQLARSLQMPEDDNNPLSLAMAQEWRATSSGDREYVQQVMSHFREEQFYYTLNPPLLSEASIDDFLFNTREGFCGHYAGTFVYLMRAAGIPARVVVGYQGGEYNRFEDYTMVYQYNAHAWAEVWFEGEGWVQFDPTGAVAPERISLGVEAVFADQPGFMEDSGFSMMRFRDYQWLNTLRLRLDALDYAWNRWVVSYDEDLQLDLMDELFGENARSGLMIALGIGTSLFFGIVAFFMLRGGRGAARDPATRLYLTLAADLAELGIPRRVGEGAGDYCRRVAMERPDLASDMEQVTRVYEQLSYASGGRQDDTELQSLLEEFRKVLRGMRLRLLSRSKRVGLTLSELGRSR
ncbi:MAG: DUF3488 and transglutaminase-like domain-containing protein [Gammaproteobacteria bacterium]|nr:DUF3488 and transglutaminase-like domain-containing protein [Gammaproteobacteria bacterium]MDP2139214.1 DUF3488 and transglutaminase-like domain-containing protein [Gammaproteobacteria bacterium]MDP2349017.1 DUF3488 and transglutaminase-like domain-containing protein [Gammaproteobacteria bacterium]